MLYYSRVAINCNLECHLMQNFDLSALLDTRGKLNRHYLEFLRVDSMSAGIYVLPANGVDPQKPHTEDEVYYVISGRSMFSCEGEVINVQAGSVIFVKANDDHRFHDITEELTVLVLFAPPEASQAT
jgi:mannose-6-phosphate isomerase-like protein (cupin superfamily)